MGYQHGKVQNSQENAEFAKTRGENQQESLRNRERDGLVFS
jgi:hypothetical protein